MSQVAVQALPFILGGLVAAAIIAFLGTPLAMRYRARFGAIDQPDAGRRVHARPIPRAGGLAVGWRSLVVGARPLGHRLAGRHRAPAPAR